MRKPRTSGQTADVAVQRTKALQRAAVAAISARGITTAALLVLTPVVARSLGTQRYGAFATLLATSAVLGIGDFGIANGLVSRIAADEWESHHNKAILSAALALLLGTTAVALLASVALAWWLPWPHWLNAASVPASQLRLAAFASFAGTALSLTLNLGQKLDLARQRGHSVALWAAGASIAGPAAAIVASMAGASFATIVIAASLASPSVFGVQTVVSLRSLPKSLRPNPFHADKHEVRYAVRTGGTFLGLAVVIAVAYRIDTVIVSSVLGAVAAARFDVVVRLYGVVTSTVQAALSQLWSAFAHAIAREDFAWARKALRRSVVIGAATSATANAAIFIVARPVIAFGLGDSFRPSTGLLAAAGVWMTYQCANHPFAMYLNGAQLERVQLLAAIPMGVSNVALSVVLTHHVGSAGPLIGSLVAHACISGFPLWVFVSRHLDRLEVNTQATSGLGLHGT